MMIWSKFEAGAKPVTVTVGDSAELMADMQHRLQTSSGFSIATLNLDHVVKLRHNPAFRDAYASHSHVTADGNPIVWLSRLARQEVSLIPGSELIDPMVRLAAELGVPVAFVGATPDSLARAGAVLVDRYPALDLVLQSSPEMGFDPTGAQAEAIIGDIAASGAGLVFLALGAPKQEIFAARAQKILSGVGFVSIGAGLDFIAGTQKRAPKWARVTAAEWLWRMLMNPKRLSGRYAACLATLPGLAAKAALARCRGA